MASIKKEIESLRAKIARLEEAQQKAEQREKALAALQGQIEKLLKDNGLSLEDYVRGNFVQVNRIIAKIAREKEKQAPTVSTGRVSKKKAAVKKRGRSKKAKLSVKIPAGKYNNIPAAPDKVFEVKEKGPRPKALKEYAEEIGLEAFFNQCRIKG
jgi:predicted  nucleic acid-binding Zn-ribbon protein